MSVKLNHYWSIVPGRDKECVDFLIGEFIPGVKEIGLQTVAVWSVIVGAYGEIVLENASSDLEIIERSLKEQQYKRLKSELLKLVKNYQTKVLVNTSKIDSYTMDVSKGTIKYNQMWNVLSHKKDDYDSFVINDYFPALESLGISVAGEWEVLIGGGPGIICEGRVSDLDNLIRNMQSKKFQTANRELKKYVVNYRSRILSFYIEN